MPEYRHTQTVQKSEEAQQVPFPERGDQNIVKDAQIQRQVQMIQKMPSEIHRRSRTCGCPVPSKQQCNRHVQYFRSRADDRRVCAVARSGVADLEQTSLRKRKGALKTPRKAFSRRCTAGVNAKEKRRRRSAFSSGFIQQKHCAQQNSKRGDARVHDRRPR